MGKIIGLSGRFKSGKSTLSKILMDRGFVKKSFADPLKRALSETYSWDLKSLYCDEGKQQRFSYPLAWDEKTHKEFVERIGAHVPFDGDRFFHSRREIMQYVGTDLCRKNDNDFHVKLLLNEIKDEDVVIDDLRFKNEMDSIKARDGMCVFVIRPFFWEYSNHKSEISLSRHDFDYVMINKRGERYLNNMGNIFFDFYISGRQPRISRTELISLIGEHGGTVKASEFLGCSRDKLVWWSKRHLVKIDQNHYTVDHNAFSTANKNSSYFAGLLSADGCIKKHTKYNYLIDFTNTEIELVEKFRKFVQSNKPIYVKNFENKKTRYEFCFSSEEMIEDMKLWCLEPRKSKANKVPDIIKDNDDLIGAWLVGLIDGDGSVYYIDKKRNFMISVLASMEVVDFVKTWSGVKGSIRQEKNIDNLFSFKCSGKNAVQLCLRIGKENISIGNKRKWDKVKDFYNRLWEK